MVDLLSRTSLRYMKKHPLQMLLSVIGITLGVAVVVSIDLANQSAAKGFELSMESVSGRATHFITAGPLGVPDSIFINLKVIHGVKKAAPVINKYIRVGGRTFNLTGVDPLSERPFRDYLNNEKRNEGVVLIAKPNSALISQKTSEELNIANGDSLEISFGAKSASLYIAGIINPENEVAESFLNNLIITDISTAQNIFDMESYLSRIDLILGSDLEKGKLEKFLPFNARIETSNAKTSVSQQMTAAFRDNLTAMSLLALIVGMFLIYNTMTFSVVQRRRHIGLMRSVGVTKNEIFRLIIQESIILGLLGTILGIIIGIFLAVAMLGLITRSINDLYFVLTVTKLTIAPLILIKGVAVGIAATLIAALKPAYEATKSSTRIVLSRSTLESGLSLNIKSLSWWGFALITAGYVILQIDVRSIYFSYLGVLPVIIGFAMLSPLLVTFLMKLFKPALSILFGAIGRLAVGGIVSQLSRTTVAIAALTVAVSAAIGIATMVNSFRTTVVDWLDNRLKGDVYLSAPSLISRFNVSTFPDSLKEIIFEAGDVRYANIYREIQLYNSEGLLHILAADIHPESQKSVTIKDSYSGESWEGLRNKNTVFVTEPFAYKNRKKVGDSIFFPVGDKEIPFGITTIYKEYSSDLGLVLMDLNKYRQLTGDNELSGASIFLRDSKDAEKYIKNLEGLLPRELKLLIRSNENLKKSSIAVFDRTFIISNVLQLLAVGVAFIGILSALMALQLERERELATLRANGLTKGQLWSLITLQTGLMGLSAGILSLPLGNALAAILTFIINQRSFGWSLDLYFMPGMIIQSLLIATVAAVLAGIYPAFKMSRTLPALALKGE